MSIDHKALLHSTDTQYKQRKEIQLEKHEKQATLKKQVFQPEIL